MPREFYAMSIEDVALCISGWMDEKREKKHWDRAMLAIMADVVNRSNGGKGASKHIIAALPLPGDKKEGGVDQRLKKRLLDKQKQLKHGNGKA